MLKKWLKSLVEEKPKTPVDKACEALQDYFDDKNISINVYIDDGKDPDVELKIEPGFGDSIIASQTDFHFSDVMAEETQKVGFILGQMSKVPTKPRSVEIDFNSIKAPDGLLLEKFITGWVAEQTKEQGR